MTLSAVVAALARQQALRAAAVAANALPAAAARHVSVAAFKQWDIRCDKLLNGGSSSVSHGTPSTGAQLQLQHGSFAARFASKAGSAKGSKPKKDSSHILSALEKAGSSKDLQALYDLVNKHGEEFDDAAVEAALKQFAAAAGDSKKQREKLHGSSEFQAVINMIAYGSQRFTPGRYAQLVSALGVLRYDDQTVVDALGRNMVEAVEEMGPEELTALLEGLSKLDNSPGILLLDAAAQRMDKLGDKVDEQQRQKVQGALKKLGHTDVKATVNPPKQQQQERAKDYA